MEFSFRAVDRPPPPPLSPPKPGRFLTSINDLRLSLAANGNCDFEKDQVSEKMLVREIKRRQEMEAELRREIMFLQWELVTLRAGKTKGVAVGDRHVPAPCSVRMCSSANEPVLEPLTLRLENATACAKASTEPTEGGLIVQEKSSMKRKALDLYELNQWLAKKRKKELTCAVCRVSITSEKLLHVHIRGRRHIAKEAKIRKANVKPRETLPIDKNGREDSVSRLKFWCDLCKMATFSSKVMEDHKNGKKHLANLAACNDRNGEEADSETAHISSDMALDSNELIKFGSAKKPKELNCALCNVSSTCEKALHDHLRGKKHMAKEAKLQGNTVGMQNRKEKLKSEQASSIGENGGDSVNGCKFRWDMCEKVAYSLKVMEDHKNGMKHLAKLAACKDRKSEEADSKTEHITSDTIVPTTEGNISLDSESSVQIQLSQMILTDQ